MMPNGVSTEISIELDLDIEQVKEKVVEFVRDSDLPLRGKLEADWRRYCISYVTQEGFRETVGVVSERRILRELKPFKSILKFGYIPEGQATNDIKRLIGEVIGKDLREYYNIQNCEVNDFRWKMKAFANGKAQSRKKRLEGSWQDRIAYQYPPRLMTSSLKCLRTLDCEQLTPDNFFRVFDKEGSTFRISIEWDSKRQEVDIGFNETADGVVQKLGQGLGFNPSRCCFKAAGEDSYLLGNHKLIQFTYVYEHLRMGQAPELLIVREDSVEVERVEGSIYIKLDKGALNPSKSGTPLSKTPSVVSSVISSSEVKHAFTVSVESLRLSQDYLGFNSSLLSSTSQGNLNAGANVQPSSTPGVSSQVLIGIKLGLYHGAKRLAPTLVHFFQSHQLQNAKQEFRFDIPLSNLPRMAKLCIGVFERKKNNCQHPLFWVNSYVFDYRSALRWRDTLHMWRYSIGEAMPTHEAALSPLRHAIANPDLKAGPAEVIVNIGGHFMESDSADKYGLTPLTPTPLVPASLIDLTPPDGNEPQILQSNAQQQIKIEFQENYGGSKNASEESSSDPDSSLTPSTSPCSSEREEESIDSTKNCHYVSKFYAQELIDIAARDPLSDLTVQEKDLIWKVRDYCRQELPHLLPRIIDCVNYSDAAQVWELHTLLSHWPILRVEQALQLLDYAYPDRKVRSFAVDCLRQHATDNDVLVYLLQLSQALKHEPHLFSDLVEFLLERALNNQHIGHYLFWQLRSEMNKCSAVSLLNGLVLETYLEAAPEHCRLLKHQTSLMEKLRSTAFSVQKLELISRDFTKAQHRFSAALRSHFSPIGQAHQQFGNFVNPLNPSQKCRRIRLSKCRLMNSKTRPQMLAFDNAESRSNHNPAPDRSQTSIDLEDDHASATASDWAMAIPRHPQAKSISHNLKKDTITMMYKKGDDLRQDILILQLVTVMDRLWKAEGMDLRMQVYRCLATAKAEGLIDVVTDSETICKIQMNSASPGTGNGTLGGATNTTWATTAAFLKKGVLCNWLKAQNQEGGLQALAMAQDQFTLSCAGYSVAAYVLGIGDRHNDNIMVKRNGQMFHIDFGHILGNFKHKFGIKRERVPMVLSSEFMEVIKSNDMGHSGTRNFARFRNLCERAYLTLRRNSSLLISLLAMMISTGLPELSSEQDLAILRSTLNLEAHSEEEALESFKRDFNESVDKEWKVRTNWWFHMSQQARTG